MVALNIHITALNIHITALNIHMLPLAEDTLAPWYVVMTLSEDGTHASEEYGLDEKNPAKWEDIPVVVLHPDETVGFGLDGEGEESDKDSDGDSLFSSNEGSHTSHHHYPSSEPPSPQAPSSINSRAG
eukprot:5079631-Pyramimonas_sp.AAC.1